MVQTISARLAMPTSTLNFDPVVACFLRNRRYGPLTQAAGLQKQNKLNPPSNVVDQGDFINQFPSEHCREEAVPLKSQQEQNAKVFSQLKLSQATSRMDLATHHHTTSTRSEKEHRCVSGIALALKSHPGHLLRVS